MMKIFMQIHLHIKFLETKYLLDYTYKCFLKSFKQFTTISLHLFIFIFLPLLSCCIYYFTNCKFCIDCVKSSICNSTYHLLHFSYLNYKYILCIEVLLAVFPYVLVYKNFSLQLDIKVFSIHFCIMPLLKVAI